MLQPALPRAAADQVRRGAGPKQDWRFSDDLPGFEERIRRPQPLKTPINLVVLRMDGQGARAAPGESVHRVPPGEMLDVVFQVVPEGGEEAARGLRGVFSGRHGRLLRVLRFRLGLLRERASR